MRGIRFAADGAGRIESKEELPKLEGRLEEQLNRAKARRARALARIKIAKAFEAKVKEAEAEAKVKEVEAEADTETEKGMETEAFEAQVAQGGGAEKRSEAEMGGEEFVMDALRLAEEAKEAAARRRRQIRRGPESGDKEGLRAYAKLVQELSLIHI